MIPRIFWRNFMRYQHLLLILLALFGTSHASERSFQSYSPEDRIFLESLHATYVKELEFQKPNYMFIFTHPQVKMKIKDSFTNLLIHWEDCMDKIRTVYQQYPQDPVLKMIEDKFSRSLTRDDRENIVKLMLLVYFGMGDLEDTASADEILELSVESMLKMQMIEAVWGENHEISERLTQLLEQDKFFRILAVAERSSDPFLHRFFQDCKDSHNLAEHLNFLDCDDDFYSALEGLDENDLTQAQEEVQKIFAEFEVLADQSFDFMDILQ